MPNQNTAELTTAGVSIWLDDLSRERLNSGNLAELIQTHNVRGVTTNPTIFANAISDSAAYTDQIAVHAANGDTAEQTLFALMCRDVADACDVMAPVFAQSGGTDGYVSIEVSPVLAHDTDATVEQAITLWKQVNKPNVMIKIPATDAGLPAISQVLAAGISVNVTLIFSLARYRQVVNAYFVGIEQARAAGRDISTIHSVASFFVSRVDSLVDASLSALSADCDHLRGKAALANARLAYEIFEQRFASERAKNLLALGAQLQRPLWASTGTKDPALPDTIYVSELVANNTVNTMPEATLKAFADHGETPQDRVTNSYRASDALLSELDGMGIDYKTITSQLETEGLEKFLVSWQELNETVQTALAEAQTT